MAFAAVKNPGSIRHDKAKRWRDGCEDLGSKSYRGASAVSLKGAQRGRRDRAAKSLDQRERVFDAPGGRVIERGHRSYIMLPAAAYDPEPRLPFLSKIIISEEPVNSFQQIQSLVELLYIVHAARDCNNR